MRKLLLVMALCFLSACASTPSADEVKASQTCIVMNRQGLFSTEVYPEKTRAEITTSKCTFLFWGCNYSLSEIDQDGTIRVKVGGFWSSQDFQYGQLAGKEIHRFKASSETGKAITALVDKIGQEQGPILINSEQAQIRYPNISGLSGALVSEGKIYEMSPSCSPAQAAVGAAAIESLNRLSH